MTAASDAADGSRDRSGSWNCGPGSWRTDGRWGRRGPDFRPLELVAVVLGFIVFWPIGLAILMWKFWQRRSGYRGDFAAYAQEKWRGLSAGFGRGEGDRRWRPFETGNTAFDDWKTAEFERLEAERKKLDEAQREFADFLHHLRQARDREEFERFMARRRGEGPA